jgi:hypothetical protein
MAVLNNSNAISTTGGYDINNSLRFRRSASAYLSRTPASNGNAQKFTYSVWLKRGVLSVDYLGLFSANTGAGGGDGCYFNSTNSIRFYVAGATAGDLVTTQVFRDSSAWYHIVVAIDTTQATASNRIKIYVNNNQVTAFSTASYPTQNYNFLNFNTSSYAQRIGQLYTGYFDGYLTEINFIDGQALTPSSFGETDIVTGSWVAKKYTGTYGTNGFYLNFSDTSALTTTTNVGLGKDFSGNANRWTTNNISITSGTTYDAMIDSPTLTSATVANYCMLNPLRYGTGSSSTTTISDGNLKFASSSNAGSVVGTMNIPSTGKWYWEAVVPTQTYNFMMVGVIKNQEALANLNGAVGLLSTGYAVYTSNGQKYNNSANSTYMAAPAQNTVVTVAYDADTGSLYVGAGGSWANGSGSTNQAFATASAAYTGITGDISPAVSFDTGNCIVNFGQRPFTYTPPTGYKALNTYNLPDSTIKKGNTVMDATLYTGTGASLSITNAGAFKPDFVWMKGRSNVRNNNLYDSVRGTTKELSSNSTGAESTNSTGLTAFNSNGWTIGSDGGINTSSETYVGWQWQAGQGTNTSNTSGSITSTVSVNTTAGFSVVTYTGTGANATVGHGLGVAPRMIIFKSRSAAQNWAVYHASIGATQYLRLNGTLAATTDSTFMNNTSPTSSVFSVGSSSDVNANTGTFVAYCWAEIAGFSKFGSYTGNASTDGPFIYTGFRPKFVMIKCSSSTTNSVWVIKDTSRNLYNTANANLYADQSLAEDTTSTVNTDLLSNGFKLRGTYPGVNAAQTYIYMAFAENPFKNSNAR